MCVLLIVLQCNSQLIVLRVIKVKTTLSTLHSVPSTDYTQLVYLRPRCTNIHTYNIYIYYASLVVYRFPPILELVPTFKSLSSQQMLMLSVTRNNHPGY